MTGAAGLLLCCLIAQAGAPPGAPPLARADPSPAAEQRRLQPALVAALHARDLPRALALVRQGAAVDAAGPDGKTVLMMVAAAGDLAAAEVLLARDADVRAANRNGGTALHYAALHPAPEMTQRLLRAGAPIDHLSGNGWSALTVAAAKGHERVVGALLDGGADPNRQDIYGWTPLMRAIDTDHPRAARTLLGSAALQIERVNDQGQSALHLAAAKGQTELVRALLAQGADPRRRDHAGRTPRELATAGGYDATAKLLLP